MELFDEARYIPAALVALATALSCEPGNKRYPIPYGLANLFYKISTHDESDKRAMNGLC